MVTVGAIATQSTWRGLGHIAVKHGEIGHFILVPLVMLWLVWVRRERLRLCEPTGTWIGPAMVTAGWAIAALGGSLAFEVLEHAGALAILVGCLLAVLGLQVFKAFLPAFALLLLIIPTPWVIHSEILMPLNILVVRASMQIYEFFGIPTQWTGGILTVGDASLPVIAVCDAPGLKAVFLVAYGFAFGRPLRSPIRVLILGLVPLIALVFQVLGTIVIASMAAMKDVNPSILGLIAGWLLLPVVFVALSGLVRVLHWAFIPVQPYSLAKDH